jgi:hypothetical protein
LGSKIDSKELTSRAQPFPAWCDAPEGVPFQKQIAPKR